MRSAFGVGAVLAAAALALAAPAPHPAKARDLLPAEDLIASSVAAVRSQADLDAHYYIAEESALALGRKADAAIARYKAGAGESLLLVVAYASAEEAGRVYGRFGRDFFSSGFDPASPRFVERIETGDWAGAVRRDRFLVIVLESPDRRSCDGLLDRAEEKATSLEIR